MYFADVGWDHLKVLIRSGMLIVLFKSSMYLKIFRLLLL